LGGIRSPENCGRAIQTLLVGESAMLFLEPRWAKLTTKQRRKRRWKERLTR